ncbi:MAG: LLM class flavin-dependent oxidoreductase, partial [Akkermansiaceae bacterium]|nr:LLM class flavin-dependent oxidoreductase [Akkermansiaceae bacterium]
MSRPIRFYVAVLPNADWNTLLGRYHQCEALGFDVAAVADHFVDWTNPPSPWFDLFTLAAAVAARTERIRILSCVAQIPLRGPAMCARQTLSVDQISNGRFELGLGIGLPIDPSYRMMGIPNWDNPERVARFTEYVEIVDSMLSNEVTSYSGKYYQIEEAV